MILQAGSCNLRWMVAVSVVISPVPLKFAIAPPQSGASPQNPQHSRRDERLDYGCYEQEWGFSLRVLDVLVNSRGFGDTVSGL